MTTLREPLKAQPNKSDISLYPSYTRLVIPYCVICRQRYARNSRKYKAFFEKQHEKIERLQPHALDAVRFHRLFCDDFKGLPEVIKMTQKQKKRLQYLLENPAI
ncbi:uncharacterized protein CBL_05893 [Carabus blaptoides fortunei]